MQTREHHSIMDVDNLAAAEKLTASIGIPPQPTVLLELNRMARRGDADLQAMGHLVSRDVGLSARVVRLASSPLFGSAQAVTSIQEALMTLGMEVFRKGVLTAAIEAAFGADAQHNRDFWRHSQVIARLSQILAERFCPELLDEAYTLGLFHDLGVIFMQRKYRGFQSLRERALLWDDAVSAEEDERWSTNHACVGFFVARRWALPAELLQAILFHHEPDLTLYEKPETRRLVAVLQLAEILQTRDRHGEPPLNYQNYEDPDHLEMIADALNFAPEEDLYNTVDQAEVLLAEF
jgi:HD-like signal output (HDOD) protein